MTATKSSRGPLFFVQSGGAILLIAMIGLRPGTWNTSRWIGLAIALPAAILLIVARYQLGGSFSVIPKAQELITCGLYSRIRNPMYIFSGLMVLGFLISLQFWPALLLLVILVPIQIFRAGQEARVLQEKFGEAYQEYRARTWF